MAVQSPDPLEEEPAKGFDGSFPKVLDEAADTPRWVYWTGLALMGVLALFAALHAATADPPAQGVQVTIDVQGAGAQAGAEGP